MYLTIKRRHNRYCSLPSFMFYIICILCVFCHVFWRYILNNFCDKLHEYMQELCKISSVCNPRRHWKYIGEYIINLFKMCPGEDRQDNLFIYSECIYMNTWNFLLSASSYSKTTYTVALHTFRNRWAHSIPCCVQLN